MAWTARARPLRPGDPTELGPYPLESRLGEGGQGIVYLGRDPGGAPVAVKLLRAHLGGDEQARAHFARELAAIEQVAGFCTARVLDADPTGDRPYIVSEYVPGPTLADLVADDGPRTGSELDRLAVGMATALAAIHRAGIVHRDFKPGNVLVGPDGPRVIDFGIARALPPGAASATASAVVGTPAYMAPEQVAGERVTPAADVFAWAATVAFAATGRSPYDANSIPAVLHRITQGTPDLTGVPPALLPLLRRCLATAPAARPDAESLLLGLLGERPAPNGPATPGAVAAPAPGVAADSPAPPAPPGAVPVNAAAAVPGAGPAPDTAPPAAPWMAGSPYGRPTAASPRRRTGWIVAGAAVAALVACAAGAGVWLATRKPDTVALPPDAPVVVRVAGDDVRASLGYDYRRLDANRRAAHAVMSARMRGRYDTQMAGIRATILREEAVNRAAVRAAGLESLSGARATALVFVDASSTTGASKTPRRQRYAIRAGLVRQGGTWLLDTVTTTPKGIAAGTEWPGPATAAVLTAARSCVTSMETIDYRHPDATITAVDRCAGGAFRTQWRAGGGKLTSAITDNRTSAHVTGVDAALTALPAANRATVIVAAGARIQGRSAAAPQTRTLRLRVTLGRSGDRWLVTGLAAA